MRIHTWDDVGADQQPTASGSNFKQHQACHAKAIGTKFIRLWQAMQAHHAKALQAPIVSRAIPIIILPA